MDYESSNFDDSVVSIDVDEEKAKTNIGETAIEASSGGDENGDGAKLLKDTLVKKETRQVFYLRVIVLAVLVSAATAIAVVVFLVTKNAEKEEMETQYSGAANKIAEAFLNIADKNMGAAGSLVVAMVDYGFKNSKGWPFVTVGSFYRRAATVKELSEALYIGINPVVSNEDRQAWENYTLNHEDAQWYRDSVVYQETLGVMDLDNRPQVQTDDPNLNLSTGVANHIYNLDRDVGAKAYISPPELFYLPIWQTSPVTRRSMVNQNRASNSEGALKCLDQDAVVFEGMQRSRAGFGSDSDPFTAEIAWLLRLANKKKTKYEGDIFSTVYLPLYDSFEVGRRTVGVMRLIIHWARFFDNLLPNNVRGVVFVLDNNCDPPYTYQVNGPEVIPLGSGDLHKPKFDKSMVEQTFKNVESIPDGTTQGLRLHQSECPYTIRIYQSDEFLQEFYSSRPVLITCSVAFVFVFTIGMFFVYDRLVERRQRLIMNKAEKTNAIVSSLFPETVRDRLMDGGEEVGKQGSSLLGKGKQVRAIMGNVGDDGKPNQASPIIADLFPNTTVLFADISGFTAWSSSRGPEQVFVLLQSIYQAFDGIAKKRHVFKVETIGDSYVAVTGLPDPQERHAIIMVRFAEECQVRLRKVVRNLEKNLGPGTGDLSMRFGIHSGPVTAGVLRGDRSRFQLFGDTVNTASRMESTGVKGRIQASPATANLLIAAGKSHWVTKREDAVHAKGKGVLSTFWVKPCSKHGSSVATSTTEESAAFEIDVVKPEELRARYVDWMTTLMLEYVKQIRATRTTTNTSPKLNDVSCGEIALEEIVEIIELPQFDEERVSAITKQKRHDIEIEEHIHELMWDMVNNISYAYRDNPFHNFEHACHVTMSVDKFMKRIVAPDIDKDQIRKWKEQSSDAKEIASTLYDYTHGVNSDPITLLAIMFSALVHDVDHRGVSNKQLMVEEEAMSNHFRHQSVAEQNSVEISWTIFMSDKMRPLREYIFADQEELQRFRQVVVNVVLATDIFDEQLNTLRRGRWDKAFSPEGATGGNLNINGLRATIVIEHIIQASDVAHTMQHWHIYQKWNKRLFQEMLQSFRSDRLGANPADFWYDGELKFFDNYIIPLAKKLKDCNVFGVSSDEVLNYAERNRAEWEDKGRELVEQFVEDFAALEEDDDELDYIPEADFDDEDICGYEV